MKSKKTGMDVIYNQQLLATINDFKNPVEDSMKPKQIKKHKLPETRFFSPYFDNRNIFLLRPCLTQPSL